MLMKGQVRYNLGYGFTEAIASGTEKMEESWNNNYGSGLGICIPVLGTFSISGGQNGTASLTSSKTTFKDINGDGLPDLIEQNMLGDLKVTLNMGNGFFRDIKHFRVFGSTLCQHGIYHQNSASIRLRYQYYAKFSRRSQRKYQPYDHCPIGYGWRWVA